MFTLLGMGVGGRVGLAINVKEEKIIKLVSAIKKENVE